MSFACSDALSGIKACSGASTLTSNGAGQSVTGAATDNADNTGQATIANVNIDKVAPTLSGAPTTSPNGSGWYHQNVSIHWTASDALSGPAATPPDSIITGDGVGLAATTSVSDKAGNTTTATSPAVKIDTTAPTTTATAPGAWNNVDVDVSLSASDALSGVKATHFTVDGGSDQTGTTVHFSAEGDFALSYWSEDNAGNVEAAHTIHVKIDKTPPTITHTTDPDANQFGWNNTDVTVTFQCDDAVSGIDSCTPPRTVTTEGAGQPVPGTAVDLAGNSASDPATVNVDRTDPTISGHAAPAPNGNGWNNTDVTVTFTCADALSGIDTCPGPTTLGEGANQSVHGTAKDAAGNSKGATVDGIDVDQTAPSLHGATTTSPNGHGWYNGDVTVAWTCSDGLTCWPVKGRIRRSDRPSPTTPGTPPRPPWAASASTGPRR